jgi:histidine triad (HIT) family protein
MDCLFCKIAAGEIPSEKVYENEYIYAFRDIAPQAPVHVLVIPKTHAASGVDEITAENSALVAKCFEAIAAIAAELGLADGYRVISNVGSHGLQSVRHLHFHLLGGRLLGENLG